MGLGHGIFCPVDTIQYQLPEIREAHLPADIPVMLAVFVRPENMVAGLFFGHIHIFTQFYITFRSQDKGTAVPPRWKGRQV